jgi:hypothetical protein
MIFSVLREAQICPRMTLNKFEKVFTGSWVFRKQKNVRAQRWLKKAHFQKDQNGLRLPEK